MYCQICRYKPVKNVLSSLWRQNIIHRPERKCQHIDPDKLRNQWHCPVQWCGKIKMISVRCQYATAPVNQTIQHKNTYQWQDWPQREIFLPKKPNFFFFSQIPLHFSGIPVHATCWYTTWSYIIFFCFFCRYLSIYTTTQKKKRGFPLFLKSFFKFSRFSPQKFLWVYP